MADLDLDALLGTPLTVVIGGQEYRARRMQDAPVGVVMRFEQFTANGVTKGAEILAALADATQVPADVLQGLTVAQLEQLVGFLSAPRPGAIKRG